PTPWREKQDDACSIGLRAIIRPVPKSAGLRFSSRPGARLSHGDACAQSASFSEVIMAALLMTNLLPKTFLRPLKILGRHEWVRWWPVDTDPPSTQFELKFPSDPELLDHLDFLQYLSHTYQKHV